MAPDLYPVSDHCDGRRFFNPRYHVNRTFAEIWRWKRSSHPAHWPSRVEVRNGDAAALLQHRHAAMWLGHATVLVRMGDSLLLTDPVFSDRAGPFGLLGPRRVHPPAVPLEELPPIDAVLLTHDHYDHCDLASLRALARRSGQTRLITPLGNGVFGRRSGFAPERIHELDWWQTHRFPSGLEVTATPARHWSNRLRGVRNGRLWSGFRVADGECFVYCAGDTGYEQTMFEDIRAKLGQPDLAILPIGAYEPRWFMAAQHCNPEEAVRIHRDLGARRSFGVHWGTFQLTDEAREAPAEALVAARAEANVAESAMPLVKPGEVVCPP